MTGTATQLGHAAAWASTFRLESAPRDVIELSKWQIANILSAIIAGSRSAAGQKLRRAMRRIQGPGPCTLIPHGERVALLDAVYLHAAYANALELDDFFYRGHLGPAVVVTPLTMAEALGLDGQAVLRAQIAANEVAGRLGWAITAEIRHGHQRSYLLRLAAATAAGVLLDLDEDRLTHALCIAMTQPELALHPGEFSPETKVLSAASSVVEGTRAALLAAEGLTAARDILEHRAGFYRQFTMHRDVPTPFVQFGEAWCTHALCFKRYSSCALAAGAIDAARELRADTSFDANEISRIEIMSSLPALIMERLADPHEPGVLTPVNVQFSIRRSVGAALILGDLRGYHFCPETFASWMPRVRSLSSATTLVHDWRFTMEQLKGFDAGLNQGGGRRSADMLQLHRTSAAFRAMFGSPRSIGVKDVGRLLTLPHADRRYFAARWMRSLRSHLRWHLAGDPGDAKPLGDLRQLSFRLGSRVTITLRGGRVLSAERMLPRGMAGDPDRGGMVHEKLIAEGAPVLGRDRCEILWNSVMVLDQAPTVTIPALASLRTEPSDERGTMRAAVDPLH